MISKSDHAGRSDLSPLICFINLRKRLCQVLPKKCTFFQFKRNRRKWTRFMCNKKASQVIRNKQPYMCAHINTHHQSKIPGSLTTSFKRTWEPFTIGEYASKCLEVHAWLKRMVSALQLFWYIESVHFSIVVWNGKEFIKIHCWHFYKR